MGCHDTVGCDDPKSRGDPVVCDESMPCVDHVHCGGLEGCDGTMDGSYPVSVGDPMGWGHFMDGCGLWGRRLTGGGDPGAATSHVVAILWAATRCLPTTPAKGEQADDPGPALVARPPPRSAKSPISGVTASDCATLTQSSSVLALGATSSRRGRHSWHSFGRTLACRPPGETVPLACWSGVFRAAAGRRGPGASCSSLPGALSSCSDTGVSATMAEREESARYAERTGGPCLGAVRTTLDSVVKTQKVQVSAVSGVPPALLGHGSSIVCRTGSPGCLPKDGSSSGPTLSAEPSY